MSASLSFVKCSLMFNLVSLRMFILFFDAEPTLLMEDVLHAGHQHALDYIQLLNF